jgi:hypothetical protein
MVSNRYSIKSQSSCRPICHPTIVLTSTLSTFHRSDSSLRFRLILKHRLQCMRDNLIIHGRGCFVPSMHGLKEHNQSLIKTRAQVYFKTNEMREMDDHFGDIYGRISDREIEITHDLAQFVLQYKEVLISCSDICGELDRYVGFSS